MKYCFQIFSILTETENEKHEKYANKSWFIRYPRLHTSPFKIRKLFDRKGSEYMESMSLIFVETQGR